MLTPSSERNSEGDETEQTPDLQVHSFRWVQFEENIKRSYQQLREKKMFYDVTISCENSEVEAHKIVLATNSDFFSRLLERSSFRNNPHPIIFIKDVKMKHLMFILEFMYTGEVKVPKNYATSVLHAAKVLEVKGLQTDDINDTGIQKRQANQFPSSSTLSFPIKRNRSDSLSPILSSDSLSPILSSDSLSRILSTDSLSPILSSSLGSSPIRLQPKIKLEESSFVENDRKENAEDDKREKDQEDTGTQENAVDYKQEKGQDDRKEKAKNDRLENVNQSIAEPSQLCMAVLDKAVSTSSPSDKKTSRESHRAALVEKVGSRLFKCKQCEYTSNASFNVKKHAEGHLSPREYKCHLCPSVVKNEVYFKDHMKAKHDIKLKL